MISRAPVRVALALVAATLLLAPAADAADRARQDGMHRSWEQRLQQRLGLTDEQTEAIRKLREQQGAAAKQHMESLRQAQAELRRLVLTQADQAAIQAKLAEVQRLLAEGVQMRVDRLKELSPILTAEQRERLAELMSQPRRFHHRDGPGQRG